MYKRSVILLFLVASTFKSHFNISCIKLVSVVKVQYFRVSTSKCWLHDAFCHVELSSPHSIWVLCFFQIVIRILCDLRGFGVIMFIANYMHQIAPLL